MFIVHSTQFSFSLSTSIYFQSRFGPSLFEIGGGDGCHLGRGCCIMGRWWTTLHLVCDRPDKRTAGRFNIHRRWLSTTGKYCFFSPSCLSINPLNSNIPHV